MARVKNYNLNSSDPAQLKKWAEDYEFIGRETSYNAAKGQLTVLAMPKSYKKKRDLENKLRARRKARESYGEEELETRFDEE